MLIWVILLPHDLLDMIKKKDETKDQSVLFFCVCVCVCVCVGWGCFEGCELFAENCMSRTVQHIMT